MGAGASAMSGETVGVAASSASPSSKKGSPAGKNTPAAGVRNNLVSLQGWHKNRIVLPASFWLRISLESLDFVHCDSLAPLVQFPFQNILCWGSNSKIFQFSVFDVDNCMVGKAPDTIPIYLFTSEGKDIEKHLMQTVRGLMADMEAVHTVTKDEFRTLRNLLFNLDSTGNRQPSDGNPAADTSPTPPTPTSSTSDPAIDGVQAAPELREDWLQVVDQFSLDRKLLAKQAMELMLLIGPLQPFDKFDLAVLLSGRILNTESFQLVINTFEDAAERENLIMRLGLDRKDFRGRTGAFTPDCKIMAEFVSVPGSPVRSIKKELEREGAAAGAAAGAGGGGGSSKETPAEGEESPRPNYGS